MKPMNVDAAPKASQVTLDVSRRHQHSCDHLKRLQAIAQPPVSTQSSQSLKSAFDLSHPVEPLPD